MAVRITSDKLRWQLLAKFPDADLKSIREAARLCDYDKAVAVLSGTVSLEELCLEPGVQLESPDVQVVSPMELAVPDEVDEKPARKAPVREEPPKKEELRIFPYYPEDDPMGDDEEKKQGGRQSKVRRTTDGWEIKCVVQDSIPCQSLRSIAGKTPSAAEQILNEIGTDNVAAYAAICFERMLEREQELEGEFFVFYHSYNAAALMYEVQAELARMLYDLPDGFAPLPRIKEKDFAGKNAAGLKAMLSRRGVQDHDPGYRLVGLSVSVTLFAFGSEAPPLRCFRHGYGCMDVQFRQLLADLLVEAGGVKKSVAEECVDKLVELAYAYGLPEAPYAKNYTHYRAPQQQPEGGEKKPPRLGGQMLQIFVAKSEVDNWAYHAHPYGHPYETDARMEEWLAGKKGPAIDGQARLLCNPQLLSDPKRARVYHYAGDWQFHGGDPEMEGSRAAFVLDMRKALAPVLGAVDKATLEKRLCGR
mmetsp:Transcript_4418/g.7623  ORF Transcript_4418/g.7623 Transcript_4418/m.7623 type:complete len:475 (-) Transcript_4418:140-1564(-)